jgi:superfamily II DNA or RNA helicase
MNFLRRDLMTPQEQYESDKEKHEAEKIAENKRQTAAQQEKEATDHEATATLFAKNAAQSRAFAELLRKL